MIAIPLAKRLSSFQPATCREKTSLVSPTIKSVLLEATLLEIQQKTWTAYTEGREKGNGDR